MSIVKRFKMYCDMTGLSVCELSRRTGLSRQTIYRVFNTGVCTTDTLEKLFEVTGLQISIKKVAK
ncbi:MAG TPA: helix-turn-helix transcriptional regulator [bacterium]|nr:helix-turn-helix transcriptional regulator [bacterium]